MGVTRLKRKDRMNKTVSKLRTSAIKRLTKTPVIKKVDIEELKKKAQTFYKVYNKKGGLCPPFLLYINKLYFYLKLI